jgi:predicted unusual protein kinase regulating ubiquinone biosynthesis (AarF/ABC1/UbiB family)
MVKNGVEVLVPVIVKVARHNLEREFQMGSLAIELMLMSSQYWAPHSKLLPFLSAMSEQIKEFTKGFEQELNFEDEAVIQRRFVDRSQKSNVWHVPQLYFSSGRILEMEFVDQAMAIKQAISEHEGKSRSRFQRKVAENFLFTILEHLIIHQEFHGDLHPGNIMVDADAQLYLIDWGNAVDMNGKWSLIWNYLTSVLAGDTESLTRVLIEMSTDPKANELRFGEIKTALDETLAKKQITPLDRRAAITLYREGQEGIHRRFQAALHLMSNTYQLGLVMQSDYLHLSRSIVAMAGTYLNMYKGVSKLTMTVDLVKDLTLFPANLIKDRLSLKREEVRRILTVGE